MINTLRFFFESFAEEQMNLLYTGDFTDELTDKLIELNNIQFNKSSKLNNTQRKVGFLIAECFQNIVRHSDLSAIDSYFHTQNRKGVFSIVSGNTVKDEIIPTLQGQLEQLNRLTSDELKETYRKTLIDGTFSQRGGAGLGLIEMARKTKNKLSFNFVKIDEIRSLFYFQLQLKTPEYEGDKLKSNLNKSVVLRDKMKSDNIFLIYKGIISTKIFQPITEIMGNSIDSSSQKMVIMALMKLLQHISEKATPNEKIHETVFVIGKDNVEHKIGSISYINNNEVPSIEKLIRTYNNEKSNYSDLKATESDQSIYNSSIEEMLKNGSKIDYHVQQKDSNLSLLTLLLTSSI